MYSLPSNLSQSLILNHQHQQYQTNSNQQHLIPQQHLMNPSCIVIGCKNGNNQSNPSIKYYQVPNLAHSNQTARQWYINTLREDLLDNLNTQNQSNNQQNPFHYVCIEHFDEESFSYAKNPNSNDSMQNEMIMILKEDAVPSLFEIEVFQKMIAHQEHFSINQQQKLQLNIQHIQSSDCNQQPNKNSLLQNLILNIDSQQTNIDNNNSNNTNTNNKRLRMDPDFRAALIQRVPKAVKRTAVLNFKPTPTPTPQSQSKLQKAIKHTFPRQSSQQPSATQQNDINKIQKAVKHTSSSSASSSSLSVANSLLKELLPPPIMQSTKRAPNSNPSIAHKAVKHTTPLQSQHQIQQAQIKQPLTQLSLNTSAPSTSTQPVITSSTSSGNKITITTTYVYKRVAQQPEIDLDLECEEEELVYIRVPPPVRAPTPPPPPPPPPPVVLVEIEPVAKALDSDLRNKSKEISSQKKNLDSTKFKEIKEEKLEKNETKEKNTASSNVNLVNKITPVLSAKSNIGKECKQAVCPEKPKLTPALASSINKIEEKTNSSISTNNNNKAGSYTNELSKFYSRRLGAMSASFLADASSSSKNQISKPTANLPLDLRVGHYPAKCNVCGIILDNNIELTSHICSHLESNGLQENELNTYISPFDAVTTTCGVCEAKFSHPFHLIKHLDTVHMKHMSEYKCRICEKQHDKLGELIEHLNKNHSHQEMPYRCDACGFRTSFYADAIYHIKKEHTSTLRHFCPYCLKSLVLPFNKKLGHVQCNIFYSHLITHFNKHENHQMIPSKCKHCTKCILHVRHMKEHLIYDHNSIQTRCTSLNDEEDDAQNDESQDSDLDVTNVEEENDLNKKRPAVKQQACSKDLKEEKEKLIKPIETKAPASMNLRKRKRSFNQTEDDLKDLKVKQELEDKQVNQIAEENTEIKCDVYEFEDQDSSKSENLKISKKTDSETMQSSDSPKPASTTTKSIQKGKRRSSRSGINSSEYSNLIKKAQSIKSAKNELLSESQSIRSLKQEPVDFEAPSLVPVYRKRQKALKQTNIKPNSSIKRRYRNRALNLELANRLNNRSRSNSPSTASSQLLSALISGNLKFSCYKSQFKCIECGETDLKSHYRTDYECHQCKYNTSCSKSFEFHLHGHLVSKRVALWNKVIKTSVEVYKCPCGFTLNSEKDNKHDANTGNRVADHLMTCEYKYCKFKSVNESLDEKANTNDCEPDILILNDFNENDENEDEHEIENYKEKIVLNKEKFNQSDEIIINDSIEEIPAF